MNDAPAPWPGWIRYPLLAVLFAVVGIGLVTVLYDKGFLPIAGPFVLIFLLPLLLPLRRRGLRGRVGRLGRRLGEQLAVLEPALEEERALAPHERPTGATDETLAEASAQIATARRQLASGQEPLAAQTVETLHRSTADGWPRRAPVRGQVAGAARTAHTLRGVLRQLDEAGRPVTDTAEDPDRAWRSGSMTCERCVDPTEYRRLDQLATDFERHAFLLRCPDCASLYEIFPEEKRPARELTADEARTLFRGAL